MAKKKDAVKKQQLLTIKVGYGLFVLTFSALLLTIIPTVSFYAAPLYREYNYTLLLVAYLFTAIAPSLVGYLSGNAATRSSASDHLRRYNGVLFGVLGVWTWALMSVVVSTWSQNIAIESGAQQALLSVAPAVLSAIVTIALSMFYARATNHQKPVIDYMPYRVTLFGVAAALTIAFPISTLFGLQYGATVWLTLLINLIMPLLFILVVGLIGYWIMGNRTGSVGERGAYALIAIAYGIITGFAFGQASNYFAQIQGQIITAGFGLGLLVWAGYLYLLRRTTR